MQNSSSSSRDLHHSTSSLSGSSSPEPASHPAAPASPSDLFDLYEKVAATRTGGRDAQIFEKLRQWTFSDFSLSAHEFAGISKAELDSWQKRHQINLSGGRIRPNPVDIQRGYAWGHIRMTAHANRLHSTLGPPSAEELGLEPA